MTYIINLKDLYFYSYIGVTDEERAVGTRLKVNISIELPFSDILEEDDIDKTVSYADLYNIIEREMGITGKLLETKALRIIKQIQKTFPDVRHGKIELEKMQPPIAGMSGSASVSLNF